MHITRRLYEYFIMGEGAYSQVFFLVLFPLERYLDFLILLIQGLIVNTWFNNTRNSQGEYPAILFCFITVFSRLLINVEDRSN